MSRLDTASRMPSGMREYLDTYGWHFSKRLCEWAVSNMRKMNPATGKMERPPLMTKDEVEELLKKHGVVLENCKGHDHVYVANMAKADYWKSSIEDDAHLAKFVKDYLDDFDGYDGMAMTRFYADCIGNGTPIVWEDML